MEGTREIREKDADNGRTRNTGGTSHFAKPPSV